MTQSPPPTPSRPPSTPAPGAGPILPAANNPPNPPSSSGLDPTPRTAAPESRTHPTNPEPADCILIAVTGMSPAVLTETVWALANEPEPILPSRIIALTTSAGRQVLERRLFGPCPHFGGLTPWDALRDALRRLGLPVDGRLRFGTTSDDIRVITTVDLLTGRSRELSDIRSPADNDAAADFLLEQVRGVVENPDTRLVASVAGGRKTMGALLYACLTLAGREIDRLTHVLVDEPFDAIQDFYFPGQPGARVQDRQGQPHDPSLARIELADVPFVPLRNLFLRELGRPVGTFSRLVERCREEVGRVVGEEIRLVVNRSRTELEVNGTPVRLAPREHLVLLFLASRAKASEPAFPSQKHAIEPLNEFRFACITEAPQSDPADWRFAPGLRTPVTEEDIRRALSAIRAKLEKAGRGAQNFAACLPAKGRFALSVPGPLILIRP